MVAGTRTGSNQFANIIPIKAGDSNGHLSHLAIINGISRSITDANNPGNVPRGPSIINVSAAMSISSAMKRVLQRVDIFAYRDFSQVDSLWRLLQLTWSSSTLLAMVIAIFALKEWVVLMECWLWEPAP